MDRETAPDKMTFSGGIEGRVRFTGSGRILAAPACMQPDKVDRATVPLFHGYIICYAGVLLLALVLDLNATAGIKRHRQVAIPVPAVVTKILGGEINSLAAKGIAEKVSYRTQNAG